MSTRDAQGGRPLRGGGTQPASAKWFRQPWVAALGWAWGKMAHDDAARVRSTHRCRNKPPQKQQKAHSTPAEPEAEQDVVMWSHVLGGSAGSGIVIPQQSQGANSPWRFGKFWGKRGACTHVVAPQNSVVLPRPRAWPCSRWASGGPGWAGRRRRRRCRAARRSCGGRS